MRHLLYLLILMAHYGLISQVGIATTQPSQAAILHVNSSSDGSSPHGGFMPPRVSNESDRNSIPAGPSDIGLLVFVEETGNLQIWNGIQWESLYTLTTVISTVVEQDFDANVSWGFSHNPAFYTVGLDRWNVLSDLGSGTESIDLVNGNFLGCRDLNNGNGGGAFFHELQFDNVDVSGLTNARIAFDYDVFEFDNGDDVQYEVFFDDIGQGSVLLVDGAANLTVEGTEIIPVPPGVSLVRLTIGITQNGDGDFAGFDRFRVYGE